MKGFWINLWPFLFVSHVAAISDTWSVGDVMGRLDSKGMLAFWRDFSISSDLPDPSDDFDRILIQIEEFQLIKPDRTRIDLLQASDEQTSVFQPDSWNFNFNDVSGIGKSLKINTEHFREKLAVFLYIFSENGTIFRESKLKVKLESKDAFLGLNFPRFLVPSDVRDSCASGRCRLEVSFGINSQMLSRSMRNTGRQGARENLVVFDLDIGQNSRMTLTNKILVNYTGNEEGLYYRDVTVSLATISPSSVGVTITAPYIEEHLMYLMLIKPGEIQAGPEDDLEYSGTDEDTEEGDDDDDTKNENVMMTTEIPKDGSESDVSDNTVDYQQTEYVEVNRYGEEEEEEKEEKEDETKSEPKRKVPSVERSDSVVARDSGNDAKIQNGWLFVSICVCLLLQI